MPHIDEEKKLKDGGEEGGRQQTLLCVEVDSVDDIADGAENKDMMFAECGSDMFVRFTIAVVQERLLTRAKVAGRVQERCTELGDLRLFLRTLLVRLRFSLRSLLVCFVTHLPRSAIVQFLVPALPIAK